jgi:hypothetical protein
MKMRQLLLLLPAALLSLCLSAGCGAPKENTVIEAPPTTAEEEAAYEQESYGGTAASDDSQN